MQLFFRRSFIDALNSARRRARSDGQADGGFTLIEMMVALFVFAILASGFALTMGGSLKAFQRSRVKTLGEQVANDKLEDARRMPYDDLGNVAGNPLGIIPFTLQQNVGGYTFTVATDVSFVNDPVSSMLATATFADYKLVVVTVTSPTGAPPVTMSTLVAPPAKPAVDKGRVTVTVLDTVSNTVMSGVYVDLVNGAAIRTDSTNAAGVVVFPALPPSPNIPALGLSDYYFVNKSANPLFPLPAGYWVYPTSDSTFLPAGAANKFTVAAATSNPKNLNLYKAASVSLILLDAQGFALYDAATVTVTATGGLGTSGSLPIPAGGLLPAFSTVAGRGIIPFDATYNYSFAISAGGNCVKTDTPVTLKNSLYPTDSSFALFEQLPCSYTDVNFHVQDASDGSAITNTVVTVTGGPVTGFSRTVTTNASGDASLRVQVETGAQPTYTATVAAVVGGRNAKTVNFMATTLAPVPVTIPVPWPTKVITVTLKDGFTGANVVGDTVNITGGPTSATFAPATTNGSGVATFTVPAGTPFPVYTITVPPDAAGRLGISGTVASTTGASALTLTDPWAMMAANVTVTDALSGLPVAGTAVQLTGGPPSAPMSSVNTNAAGLATFSVPVGTSPNYTINVPAFGGRNAAATTTFSPVGPGPVAVPVTVDWPMNTLTVSVKGFPSNNPLAGRTVQITAGPDSPWTPPSQDTTGSGQVTFNLPVGATSYTITVPAFGGFPLSTATKVVTVAPVPNVVTVNVLGA